MNCAYLSSNSMTSRREQLGDTCCLKTRFGEPKCSSQTGTSCTTCFWTAVSGKKASYGCDKAYTTIASYSCSISGYFPEDHDYVWDVFNSTVERHKKNERTVTSSALTGLVATTLRTEDDVWKDLWELRRHLGATDFERDFLNIIVGVRDEGRDEEEYVVHWQPSEAV